MQQSVTVCCTNATACMHNTKCHASIKCRLTTTPPFGNSRPREKGIITRTMGKPQKDQDGSRGKKPMNNKTSIIKEKKSAIKPLKWPLNAVGGVPLTQTPWLPRRHSEDGPQVPKWHHKRHNLSTIPGTPPGSCASAYLRCTPPQIRPPHSQGQKQQPAGGAQRHGGASTKKHGRHCGHCQSQLASPPGKTPSPHVQGLGMVPQTKG